MDEFTLPPWITGLKRQVLLDYIKGTKPKVIMQTHNVSVGFINEARKKYAIPSQVELRRQGILPPTPFGEGSTLNSRLDREARLDLAVDEYINGNIGVAALAKKHHISSAKLSDALKAKGITIKRGRASGSGKGSSSLSDRNRAIVDAVVKESKTLKEVGDAQDPPISRERVRQICAEAGHKVGYREQIKARIRTRREAVRYRHPQESEIVQVLQEDRHYPKDIAARFGVTIGYLQQLRDRYKIPKSNRLNWKSDDRLAREKAAIDAYFNRLDLTSEYISHNILKDKNPASITQMIKRRGLPRTRGKLKFGESYAPGSGPRRKYPPELKQQMLEAYVNPETKITNLLREHGIVQATFNNWRKVAGLPVVTRSCKVVMSAFRALSQEQLAELDRALKNALEAGKSRNRVATELSLPLRGVIARANELGLIFPPAGPSQLTRNTPLTDEELEKLDAALLAGHQAGKSMPVIAKETGHSHGRISRRANRLGLRFSIRPAIVLEGGIHGKKQRVKQIRDKALPIFRKRSTDLQQETQETKPVLFRQQLTVEQRAERDRNIIAAYERGDRTSEIMDQYGVVNSQLYKILANNGVQRGRASIAGKKREPTSQEREVLDMYASGMQRFEIFDRVPWLEGDEVKLYNLVNWFGVKRPPDFRTVRKQVARIPEAQRQSVLDKYTPGETIVTELAEKVGLRYSTTKRILEEAGVYKPVPLGTKRRKA